MTIRTKPVFYYDYIVTADDIYINFDDGLGERTATVSGGTYTFTDLASSVALALNEVGGQVYSVDTDRVNRKYTISADSNFDILFGSGSNAGLSVASVIGFNNTDKSGSNSYVGDSAAGKEYSPQFPLQSFISLDDYEELGSANINKTGSGVVEVYTLGEERFTEFNIKYVTNLNVGGELPYSPNAVEELRDFMKFITRKYPVEMMVDQDNRVSFDTLILEKTPSSSNGIGYKLKEMYSNKMPDFFETGLLKFRERVS